MARIELTKGYAATIDDDLLPLLSQWKWTTFIGGGGRPYAGRRECCADGRRRLVLMHRVINDTPDGLHTDHVDGDSLNNRRANLRTATPRQNQMNKQPNRGGTSQLKGAWFDPGPRNTKPWRSAIRVNGRLHYLGRFTTQEQAAAAYAAAAAEHFGAFARTQNGASR